MQTLKEFCRVHRIEKISNVKISQVGNLYCKFIGTSFTFYILFDLKTSELVSEGDEPKAIKDFYIDFIETSWDGGDWRIVHNNNLTQ
jgi:hypothetical protein